MVYPAKVLYQRKEKDLTATRRKTCRKRVACINRSPPMAWVAPYVIDHFRNGQQTSRTSYDSVEFNKPIADALFAKPASFKQLSDHFSFNILRSAHLSTVNCSRHA